MNELRTKLVRATEGLSLEQFVWLYSWPESSFQRVIDELDEGLPCYIGKGREQEIYDEGLAEIEKAKEKFPTESEEDYDRDTFAWDDATGYF